MIAKGPVTRPELMRRTGLSDRVIRKQIEKLREEGWFIVNAEDGLGYYLAEETMDILRQYKSDKAKALSILKRLKHMRRYLKERGEAV